MRSKSLIAIAAASACLLASGCMFKTQHAFPQHTYFGRAPDAASVEKREAFAHEASKNWALAGLVAWSDWGVVDLAPENRRNQRIENASLETIFDELDTVVWVIPGFAYGYYFWAPRTIRFAGDQVTGAQP